MLNYRTLPHGERGLANAHRLAPHIVDCEPISWFGGSRTGRRNPVRRSTRAGFLIGLLGGGGVGLLMQALAQGL
jgi:hypothetical protein